MIKICINPDGSVTVQGTNAEFPKVDKQMKKVGKIRGADWNECQKVSSDEWKKMPIEERALHLCG